MVRRTISVSPAVDEKILKIAEEEGSYSAAVARLVDEGARRMGKNELPDWIGSFEGPADLSENLDKYIKQALKRGRRR
jgi:predicted CopG family antitoxin